MNVSVYVRSLGPCWPDHWVAGKAGAFKAKNMIASPVLNTS